MDDSLALVGLRGLLLMGKKGKEEGRREEEGMGREGSRRGRKGRGELRLCWIAALVSHSLSSARTDHKRHTYVSSYSSLVRNNILKVQISNNFDAVFT